MNNIPVCHIAKWAVGVALCVVLAPQLPAQEPNKTPKSEGTIKAAVGVEAGLFERQMKLIEQRRSAWLAKAEKAMSKLIRTPMKPVAVVKMEKDAASFQGWKTVVADKPESVCNRPLMPGDSFIFDFASPYKSHLMNSYCHAWSCTPTYLLGRSPL